MPNFYEDVNEEDSAASIVEERRFEDGQPSKIRLRLKEFHDWSKSGIGKKTEVCLVGHRPVESIY